MMARETLFGLRESGWKAIDAASLAFILTINGARVLALSKRTKKYAKLGMKTKNWNRMNSASDVLLVFTLLRGLVDTLEEYDFLVKKDAIFPGRGLIPTVVVNAAKGLKSVPAAVETTALSVRNIF